MRKNELSVIIGFDAIPQSSSLARRTPRYAMIILEGDQVEVFNSVRRGELVRTIRKYVPDAIATDNLFELAPNEKAVIELLSKIPSKTRVIQVTGSPVHGMTSLTKLANRHGFSLRKHPNPVETAILVAKLAGLGIGTEVSALARETKIIITRSRSIGSGGFSQSRYQRRMQGAIQQVARSIIDRLTRAGLDFDKYETRASLGWSRCVIYVYESFDNVSAVIQSEVNKIAGVAVRVSPVKHRSILYLPRGEKEEISRPRRQLVVGIDAGTTVGIAVADVTGHLLTLHSGRGMTRGDVIRYVVEFGMPILIATDVTSTPSFVEKLSNSLKASLFTPARLLTVAEKRELAKSFAMKFSLRPANAHQRDALAAVAKVFQVYDKRLQLLNKRLQEENQVKLTPEASAHILRGTSVQKAIELSAATLESDQKALSPTVPSSKAKPSLQESQELVGKHQRKIKSLERKLEYEKDQHKRSLEKQQQLENALKTTRRQLDQIFNQEQRDLRRDKVYHQKEQQIGRLHKQVEELQIKLESMERMLTNLKLMRQLEIRGEVRPVILLPHFSQEEIRRLVDKYSQRRGKVVYILDPSGGGRSTAEQLINLGIKVLIIKGAMSHLALRQFNAAHIPVINAENLRITIVDEFAVVDIKQLDEQIINWQKSQHTNEREVAAEALERLVEEYRQERRSEDKKD